eukprot:symbB.v1.2.034313.t1/scaffold4408.1/size40047/3
MDNSLRTTVPGVLTKTPSERGSFDGTVIDELEKSLDSKIDELQAAITSGQPGVVERQNVVDAAQKEFLFRLWFWFRFRFWQGELTSAEEAQQKASTALCSAKEAQKEASTVVSKAKDAVAAYKTEYKSATKTRDEKQAELQDFVDGSLATFQELKLRCKKRKVDEAEAEVTQES